MITIAIKNLIYRPLQLVLSVLLFALGTSLITALVLINEQIGDQFDKNLAGIDLVIGAKGSPLQLILCNMYHIDAPTGNISLEESKAFMNPKHPLIKRAIPLSLGDNYKGFRIVGTTPGFLNLYEHSWREGRIWQNDFEVVIGAAVAAKTGLVLGSSFYSAHGFVDDEDLVHDYTDPFVVVGILEPTGSVLDQLILCTSETVWLVHAHGEQEKGTEILEERVIDVLSDGPYTEEQLTIWHEAALSKLLENEEMDITSLLVQFRGVNYQTLNMQRNINENTNLQAATPAVEINRLYALLGTGADALRILAIIIMVVSGFSVFISLYSSLRQRKYELALLRVTGASKIKIFFLIITEGLMVTMMGYFSGVLMGHMAVFFMASSLEATYKYTFSAWYFADQEWHLIIAAIAIGIGASVIPALQAYGTDISKTLTRG